MNRPLRAAALATALSLIVHVPADAQSWQRSGSRYSQSHASADTVGRRPATGLEDAIEFSGWRVPLVRIVNLIDGLGRELQEPGLYELAIRTVDDLAGPRHPFAGYLHVRLSYRYWMAGETARAFDHAVLGEDILREHLYLRLRSLSDAESRRLARLRETALDLILTIAAQQNDGATSGRAWDAFVRSRAIVLDEMASRKRTVDTSSDSTLRRLNDALAQTRETLAERSFEPPSQSGSDRVTLDGLRARRDSLERELARKSSTFRRDLIRTRAGLDDVLRTLAPDEALVSYACYLEFPTAERRAPHARRWTAEAERLAPRPMVLAFVLRPSQGAPRVVRIARAEEVDARVAAWRAALARQMSAEDDSLANAGLNVSGDSLRKLVWDPVAATVRTARRVFVVLDGSLQLMSMEALPLDPLARRYVIEDSPVLNYLSAERDLMRRMEPATDACHLVAIGVSRFTRPDPAGPRRAERARPTTPCGDLSTADLPDLPGSEKEVRNISSLWSRTHSSSTAKCISSLFTGEDATKANFAIEAPLASVLHVATHGFFMQCPLEQPSGRPNRPSRGQDLAPPPLGMVDPLLLAGLVFTPSAEAGSGRSEVLTAEEVGSLDLSRADIVVLSGCETGAGLVESREGLLGLRRAFSVAGVGSMLVSLWPVQDVSTEAFMRGLYADRPGRPMDLAESTHQAELQLLQELRRLGLGTSPAGWAGFVVVGVPRPRQL